MGNVGKRIAVAGALGGGVLTAVLLVRFALEADGGARGDRGDGGTDDRALVDSVRNEDASRTPGTRSAPTRKRAVVRDRAQRVPVWRGDLLKAIAGLEGESDRTAAVSRARDIERLARLLGADMGDAARDRLLALLIAGDHPVALRSIGNALGEYGVHAETARRLQGIFDQVRGDREKLLPVSRALAGTGTSEIAAELLDRLDLTDRLVALEIVRIAGFVRGTEIEGRLVALLRQDLPVEVRRAIERGWRNSRGQASYEALLDGLDAAAPDAQVSYLRILAMSKDRAHAARIRQVLDRSGSAAVQVAAVQALASVGDADSARLVVEIAVRRGPAARDEAQRSIQRIQDEGGVVLAVARWDELRPVGRSGVMQAARRLKDPSPALLAAARSALTDESGSVRGHAALLLGQRGRDEFVAPLREFLRDNPHPRECLSAVQALRAIGSEAAARIALDNVERIPEEMRASFRQLLDADLKNAE